MDNKKNIPYNHAAANHNMNAASEIAPLLIKIFQPKAVADAGCGTGTFLRVFKDCGVNDITGIDGWWVNKDELLIPKENFLEYDIQQPFALNKKFDLVLCLEVAEHLAESSADGFIKSLTALGDIIIFSAAIPNQGGQNHINEQPFAYWINKFSVHGYSFKDVFRNYFWNNEKIDWWYRQNMFLVVKNSVDISSYSFPLLPSNSINEFVHPELLSLYAEKTRLLEKKLNKLLSGNADGRQYIQLAGKAIKRKLKRKK